MTRRLAEVAKYVGVSEATVSRVLNGKPGISDATRAAVLTALDVLGYERPTKLRGERARLVGLVLPELQNPIFPAFAEVVAGALAQRGFTPVLCTRTAGGVSEADYVECCSTSRCPASIFAGGHYAQAAADARALPPPARARPARGAGQRRDRGPRLPAGLGRRRARGGPGVRPPGLARARARSGWSSGPADHVPSDRKLAAVRRRAARLRRTPSARRTSSAAIFSMEGGQAAATRLLKRGVTGIICASDVLALGAIRAARRLGLEVPDDISVVGYDDSPFMNCTDPPLTTVRQPIEAMGQAAVDLLVSQIAGTPVPTDEMLFEPELVVRGSTGALKVAPAEGRRRRPPPRKFRYRIESATAPRLLHGVVALFRCVRKQMFCR